MKRFVATALLLMVLSASLFAQKTKIAVLGVEKKDSKSANIINSLLKRDFKAIFKDSQQLELIDIKSTQKDVKSLGYTDLFILEESSLTEISNKVKADILVWGDVSSVSRTEFKFNVMIYETKSKDITTCNFNIPNKKDDRRDILSDKLLNKLEEFAGSALEKAIGIAQQHFYSGSFPAAEKAYLDVLTIDSQNLEAFLNLGYIAFKQSKFEKSVDYFNQGLAIHPGNRKLLEYSSLAYKKQGNTEEAINALVQITETENDSIIWLKIGNIYAEEEEYDSAIEAFEKALEVNADYGRANLKLALVLFDIEYYEEAIPYLEKTAEIYPDNEDVASKLAISYKKANKLADAIAQYKSVIDETPDKIKAYYDLAGAYSALASDALSFDEKETNLTNAVNILKDAEQFETEKAKLYTRQASIFIKIAKEYNFAGKKKTSKEYFQKALTKLLAQKEIDPDNIKMYSKLAETYYAVGKLADAEKSALRAAELDKEDHEPYMQLFMIFQKKGYDKYNKFATQEKDSKSGKYYGDELDKLIAERDNTKEEAHRYFLKAKKYLLEAKGRANSAGMKNSINDKLISVKKLLTETEKSF